MLFKLQSCRLNVTFIFFAVCPSRFWVGLLVLPSDNVLFLSWRWQFWKREAEKWRILPSAWALLCAQQSHVVLHVANRPGNLGHHVNTYPYGEGGTRRTCQSQIRGLWYWVIRLTEVGIFLWVHIRSTKLWIRPAFGKCVSNKPR